MPLLYEGHTETLMDRTDMENGFLKTASGTTGDRRLYRDQKWNYAFRMHGAAASLCGRCYGRRRHKAFVLRQCGIGAGLFHLAATHPCRKQTRLTQSHPEVTFA